MVSHKRVKVPERYVVYEPPFYPQYAISDIGSSPGSSSIQSNAGSFPPSDTPSHSSRTQDGEGHHGRRRRRRHENRDPAGHIQEEQQRQQQSYNTYPQTQDPQQPPQYASYNVGMGDAAQYDPNNVNHFQYADTDGTHAQSLQHYRLGNYAAADDGPWNDQQHHYYHPGNDGQGQGQGGQIQGQGQGHQSYHGHHYGGGSFAAPNYAGYPYAATMGEDEGQEDYQWDDGTTGGQ